MPWMHLRLCAPLAAFGGTAIDALGVTRDFPAQSMLVGLLANALGWTRRMRAAHQSLQDRLVFGAVHEREPAPVTDYQIARLYEEDSAWSTRGTPIGRQRSTSYGRRDAKGRWLAHQRWRDYRADLCLSVVARLDPEGAAPTLGEVAKALQRPARTLFIGRKACLPSAPIFTGWVEAPSAREALEAVVPAGATDLAAVWPAVGGIEAAARITELTDERNWISGLHGGSRRVCEGRLSAPESKA